MKQHLFTRKLFSIGIILILFLNSCIKDSIQELGNISGIEVNPQVSVPILNTHMGIKDIYGSFSNKAYIVEGSDKFISFIYESDGNLSNTQFVVIPIVNVDYTLSMNQAAVNQFNSIGTYTTNYNNTATIKTDNSERIKKISVKTGYFYLSITSTYKHNGIVVVKYPSLSKNGNTLIDTIHLNYNGTSPVMINKSIDISGYDIDLSNNGNNYNLIPYTIDMTIVRNPLYSVTVNDQVMVSEQMNVQEYNLIQGYLGKFTVLNYTVDNTLDIFDKRADQNIFMKDPKLKINIQNAIGIPITAKISNINIVSGKGINYPVIVNQFKDTFTFAYPNISQQGDTINSYFVIDKTNSNIDSVFSRAPQRISYDVNFIANYNQDVTLNNFIMGRNNTFNSYATTELPLEIKVYSYQLRSIDSLSWPKIPDGLNLEWAKISGWYQNSFPISNTVQLYFAKDSVILGVDSFVVVDSLYSRPVYVPGAIIDANGKLLQPSVVTNETVMSAAKYDQLKKTANKTILISTARTSDYNGSFPFVKIYSDQGMDFKIGVEAKGNYKKSFK